MEEARAIQGGAFALGGVGEGSQGESSQPHPEPDPLSTGFHLHVRDISLHHEAEGPGDLYAPPGSGDIGANPAHHVPQLAQEKGRGGQRLGENKGDLAQEPVK